MWVGNPEADGKHKRPLNYIGYIFFKAKTRKILFSDNWMRAFNGFHKIFELSAERRRVADTNPNGIKK
jgi:hypothetical protein